MTELSIFLGLLLFTCCVIFALARSKKSGGMVLLDWSVIGVGLIYGLGWATVLGLTESGYNDHWSAWLLPYEHYYVIGNCLAFVMAFSIIIGWSISSRVQRLAGRLSSKSLAFDAEKVHVYAWIIFAIGFFLRWLYAMDFGGLVAYLDHAAAIRSAIFEVHNRFSFLQPFGMVPVFSSFLFFASYMSGKRSALKILGFALSASFSVYVLYSFLGRIGFLVYLATFALAFLQLRRVKPAKLIVGGIVGGPLVVVSAYVLSNLLGISGSNSLPGYVAKELSFPFASFFAQLESGEHLFRWYVDFLISPIYVLPSSWWSEWAVDVSQINTMIVSGAMKGDSGVTGGIPVDLLTLGLMQTSVFGVPAVGILFGVLIRGLQGFCESIRDDGLRAVLWSFIAIRVATYAIAYAQPVHLITGTFGVAFSILLLYFLSFGSRLRIGQSN